MEDTFYYIGIDLHEEWAMVSSFRQGMKEPETMSTVVGSEVYQIPMLLAKRRGIGQWFFGDEAKKTADTEQTKVIDRLLERARRRETVTVEGEDYDALQLLGLFLKKLLLLPNRLGRFERTDMLILVVERLSPQDMQMFQELLPQLGMTQEHVAVIDRKESFYYYLYHQSEDLWLHDVFLFDYSKERMRCLVAEKNKKTTPQLIVIEEVTTSINSNDKDASFAGVVQKLFQRRIVSSAFLIGDGFDGKWMQKSLTELCRGRRVFMGKNLYSKGACYAAYARSAHEEWGFVYMGDNEMKVNVSLKVTRKGVTQFYSLISAGESWYEANGLCEVLLTGEPEVSFWLQLPDSDEAKVQTLELENLPERPDRMTRLRIQAKPTSDEEVQIKITDMGFGEFYKSSDMSWEYRMKL